MPPKRKTLTFEEKGIILDKLARGVRVITVANEYGVNESSIRTIRKNGDKIRAALLAGNAATSKSLRSASNIVLARTEKLLIKYLDRQRKSGIGVDNKLLSAKACHFYNVLSAKMDVASPQPFGASKGWLRSFNKRHNLHRKKFTGESVSADANAASAYPAFFRDIMLEGGYTADQVYNADETGLIWKKMPDSTYIARETKKAPGRKAYKDRFTLLLCCNASGTHKMKPTVVHKSLNPRSYARVTDRGVYWYKNKAAWVTQAVTNEWFDDHFVPDAREHCRKMNVDFKVLLILDNAPGHPHLLEGRHPDVKVVFLPPNTTSILQPLDQELIAILKAKYYSYLFKKFHTSLDDDVELEEELAEPQAGPSSAPDTPLAPLLTAQVLSYWRSYNIRQAIDFVLKAWDEVSIPAIVRAWLPLMGGIPDKASPTSITSASVLEELHAAAAALPGFEEVGREELMALINMQQDDDDVNLDDLLEEEVEEQEMEEAVPVPQEIVGNIGVSDLRYVLSVFATLCDAITNRDLDSDRASQNVLSMKNVFSTYQRMYYDHVNNSQQRHITEFLRRRVPTPANSDADIDELMAEELDDVSVVSTLDFSGFGEEPEGDGEDSQSSSSQE